MQAVPKPIGPPARKPPVLPLHDFVPGKQDHPKRRQPGPKRRDHSEKSRQHQADKRELHRHADGGDQQAAVNSQSEQYGETGIDQNKDTRQGKIAVIQGNVAGHWPHLLPDASRLDHQLPTAMRLAWPHRA